MKFVWATFIMCSGALIFHFVLSNSHLILAVSGTMKCCPELWSGRLWQRKNVSRSDTSYWALCTLCEIEWHPAVLFAKKWVRIHCCIMWMEKEFLYKNPVMHIQSGGNSWFMLIFLLLLVVLQKGGFFGFFKKKQNE